MPVLDTLERALKHDDSNDVRAGLGVTPIDVAGQPFGSRGAAVGARGFLLDDDRLRPAPVVGAKPK